VAAVAGLLDDVVQHMDQAVARTKSWNDNGHHHSGHGDRYVTGDVNWDGYGLPALQGMVAAPASPAQVQTVAGLWRGNGASITQGAENLSQSLTTLMNYWQGSAAKQVSDSVANTASWISAVGQTAGKVADLVEDAGGALQSAQNTMPGTPPSSLLLTYNTAADGAAAGAAGGPFGAAAGTMVGGLASVFAAGAVQGALKQQAVQTMQRYEQAAVSIDTTTPQFTPPPVWGSSSGGNLNSVVGPSPVTVPTTGTLTQSGADVSTVPSFADSPTGRWNALTGGGQYGSQFGGVGRVGSAHLGMGFFGGGMAGMRGTEEARAANTSVSPGVGAVAAAGENPAGVVGRPDSSSSLLEDVDGRAGGGAVPMGAGGMGGAGARGGADADYRRRIPFEEDPFVTGLKAVPPVIGLNAVDRETEK